MYIKSINFCFYKKISFSEHISNATTLGSKCVVPSKASLHPHLDKNRKNVPSNFLAVSKV
jgi:hypothetical protein